MNPYTGAAAMNVGTEYRRVPAELFIGLRMELSLLSVGCFRTKATDLQHSAGMGRAELGGGAALGVQCCASGCSQPREQCGCSGYTVRCISGMVLFLPLLRQA